MKAENANCVKCKHFHITWDKSFPNGCRLFGFKSSKMPSITVREATGNGCVNFEEKRRES